MRFKYKLKCGNCDWGLVAYLIADGPDDYVTEGFECLDCNGEGYNEYTEVYDSLDDLYADYGDDIISVQTLSEGKETCNA